MNSVLQCLAYTPALTETILSTKLHLPKPGEFDALIATRDLIDRLLSLRPGLWATPGHHARNLKAISKSFRFGRQEDAHEFLIALLDAMHESLLAAYKQKPASAVQETSMIFRIFSGSIRSQVQCADCGYASRTADPFLDISLEITGANSVEKALQRFTSVEHLEGENKYMCPKQACKVRASKCISIEKEPRVLVLQLKRFEYSIHGQKLNKKVDFETVLDLRPYMSDRRSGPVLYELYGVLVHNGHSVHSGHYYSFVRGPNGMWYHMDDSRVSQVSERIVLGQKAYILFYIRRDDMMPPLPRPLASNASRLYGSTASMKPANGPLQSSLRTTVPQSVRSPKRKWEEDEKAGNKRQSIEQGLRQSQGSTLQALQVGPASTSAPIKTPGQNLSLKANGGFDPEALRQRLASQFDATPSQTRSLSAPRPYRHPMLENQLRKGPSAAKKRKDQLRQLRAQNAAVQPPATSPNGKSANGKASRKLDARLQLHKRYSQSLGSTPPFIESPGMYGSSPLSFMPAIGTGEDPVEPASARRSPRIAKQRSAFNGSPPPLPVSPPPSATFADSSNHRLAPEIAASDGQPGYATPKQHLGSPQTSARPSGGQTGIILQESAFATPIANGDGASLKTRAQTGNSALSPTRSSPRQKRPAEQARVAATGVGVTENSIQSAGNGVGLLANGNSPLQKRAKIDSTAPADSQTEEDGYTQTQTRLQHKAANGRLTSIRPDDNDEETIRLEDLPIRTPGKAQKRKAMNETAELQSSENSKRKVKDVLGLTSAEEAGPAGQSMWAHVSASDREAADVMLRSMEPARKATDAYDIEYDQGKKKKVKGEAQADGLGNGNAFQEMWDRRKGGPVSPGKRNRRRTT